MFKINKKIILSFISLFILAGCTSDSEEELYSNCETDNMSFQIHISPYLENNCISCHNQNLSSGGIDYSRFAGIKSGVDDGSLLGSIKHETEYEAMPPNEPKTDDCKINQIKAWINPGSNK
ncbi:MAG: hypothetical protein JKX79_05680 [Labilibaculum sp.]|nr:hypothetical protein [Labilibaculum sp.]